MTGRFSVPPSYWDEVAAEKGSGSAYRRDPVGDLPVGRSAVERERADLAAALRDVEGSARVLGAVLALLAARARTVSASPTGRLVMAATSQAAGLLEDVARAAGVTPVAPAGPVLDDSDLDRKGSMQLMREQREDVERAERMTSARRLRGGIKRAAAQQTTDQEQGQ